MRQVAISAAAASEPGRQVASETVRLSAAIIGPLHEYSRVHLADLDKVGVQAASWKHQCVVPMQYLMNVMSMIPKKNMGDYRMIAAMASGWRMDTKLDKQGART